MSVTGQTSIALGALPDLPLKPARILVVDDDERNLLALSQVLADIAEVVTTTSGRGALRHLLQGDFAVILLDVFMPGMDGYEVASLIRERQQTARIPIIFLSAVNKETEHLMRGYAMGAVDYVFKPVEAAVLRSKVGVFVDLYNMRAQIEAKGREEGELREKTFQAELEKLKVERELEESRLRQATMLEVLPLVLFEASADTDGRLRRVFVAGDLARIAGEAAAAINAGQLRWEDRIHRDDRSGLPQLTPGRTTALEYRWAVEGGPTRHFIEQCVCISEEGEDGRWVGTLIDVTERKQLEAQLLQAGKLEAIGRLTGGIAHDFNNLLAAVLGGLDLVQRRTAFAERDQLILDGMRHAAEKGVELVRRMMAFARKQDLHPVAVEPQSLCASVAGLVEHTLGGTVDLAWECAPTTANFYADRSQLELAVMNLVLNARDAMPEGGAIGVEIRDASQDEIKQNGLAPGPYLSVSVTDEGIGIPDAIISKITEPFFTTKEAGKGTGLGLSMVVGFVHQSGGRTEIRSQEGIGTCISFLLPATCEKMAEDTPSIMKRQPECTNGISILVVDDDEHVLAVLVEQLGDWGMEVVGVTNGSAALEMIRKDPERFDVMLTDYAMPGINGAELIVQILGVNNHLKCLLMTGCVNDQIKFILPTGVYMLNKPIDMAILNEIICLL
ncbi:response regulator [Novosphingobium sp.]|uniref:response regulator n=1 Tax=Novosphingobium sp. TaxID=1874826 RepID=UPI0038BC5622